jgi:hypothetical protein
MMCSGEGWTRLLQKVTLRFVQLVVAAMIVIGLGLAGGLT